MRDQTLSSPAHTYIPLLCPGGRLGAPPQSTHLGFLVLAPFLSCTREDFFIVLSQEGTHGFGPLLRQKWQPHPTSSRSPVTAIPLLAPIWELSSQISPKPLKGPYRKEPGPEPKEVGQRSQNSTPACPSAPTSNSEVNRKPLASKESSGRQLGVGLSLWGSRRVPCKGRQPPYPVSGRQLKISALAWWTTHPWEWLVAGAGSPHTSRL